MLLKSSSNPALNSWFQQSESNSIITHHQNLKSPKSISFNSPQNKKITRTLSDSDLSSFTRSKRVNCLRSSSSPCIDVVEDVEGEEIESNGFLFSSSGLDGNEGCRIEFLMDGTGTGNGGNGGGKKCSSGGGGSNDDSTDVYYQNMIDANPNNSLILGNYAKYLKEVRGDALKAEEYCSRAILANPSDGNALSMYADLIWETHKDSSRAQNYFDQAVKASPDDCYVMASYARFLWDANEEEEEEYSTMSISAPSFLHEASQHFPSVAAS